MQMAHSAAGGVGFGAGRSSITTDTNIDLTWLVRCCDRWRFGEGHLLSSVLYYFDDIIDITWTGQSNGGTGQHRRRSPRRLRLTALPCIANQYILITHIVSPLTDSHSLHRAHHHALLGIPAGWTGSHPAQEEEGCYSFKVNIRWNRKYGRNC